MEKAHRARREENVGSSWWSKVDRFDVSGAWYGGCGAAKCDEQKDVAGVRNVATPRRFRLPQRVLRGNSASIWVPASDALFWDKRCLVCGWTHPWPHSCVAMCRYLRGAQVHKKKGSCAPVLFLANATRPRHSIVRIMATKLTKCLELEFVPNVLQALQASMNDDWRTNFFTYTPCCASFGPCAYQFVFVYANRACPQCAKDEARRCWQSADVRRLLRSLIACFALLEMGWMYTLPIPCHQAEKSEEEHSGCVLRFGRRTSKASGDFATRGSTRTTRNVRQHLYAPCHKFQSAVIQLSFVCYKQGMGPWQSRNADGNSICVHPSPR